MRNFKKLALVGAFVVTTAFSVTACGSSTAQHRKQQLLTARQNRTAREQLTEKNSQDLQSLRQQLLQKQKAQQQKLQSNINKIGGQPEQGTVLRSGVGLSLVVL